jgi:heptosyltransferase-3
MLSDGIDLQGVRRVLVIKLRHHGDVLLASPVFSLLKARAPHLEIDALVYQETAPLLIHHPAISHVHTIDRAWKRQGFANQIRAEWRLFRTLQVRKYDLLVHLTEHYRGAWLRCLLGLRYAVAPAREGANWLWRKSFTHYYVFPRQRPRHTVETNLDALRRVGVYPEEAEKRLVLQPGSEAQENVDAILAQHGLESGRFIHIHPGSRWSFKCWPAVKTAELINRLGAAGWRLVLTAAPDPAETQLVHAILASTHVPIVNLSGQLTLSELAALTAQARLFIGVDSAPMHIAAAMQTPIVVLFGPSGEAEWGPWMVPHRVVSSNHICRPCGRDGCGGGKVSECLTTLPVGQVLAAVHDLLAATHTRPAAGAAS